MKLNIRLMYLYLFSFIGLLVVVIGAIQLVNLGMKTFIFVDADVYDYTVYLKEGKEELRNEEEMERQKIQTSRQRQREFSNAVSMIIIGAPLYFYHWKTIQKEKEVV